MVSRISMAVVLVALVFMVGCAAHVHTIGEGRAAGTGDMVEMRQWYALWGMVPINTVDTKAIAMGSTDYEIRTEQTPFDFILNIFTSWVSIVSRTVTVTK